MNRKLPKRILALALGSLLSVSAAGSQPAAAQGKAADTADAPAYEERLTPIMGWSSWNEFNVEISETLFKEQMDLMVEYGLVDAGYEYFNVDDGYQGGRDPDTGLVKNHPVRFPNGLKVIADYAHARGMKAGIYTDAGKNTCASRANGEGDKPHNGRPGSGYGLGVGLYGHEEEDLRQYFDDWGFDFIKVDWCGGQDLGLNQQDRYTMISDQIQKVRERLQKDIIYNVCCWQFPGEWVLDTTADSWRTGGDIWADFSSVLSQIDNIKELAPYHGPGHHNDLDMLQVGRGMTHEEDKTHFAMWCMMSAPLMIGTDLRDISEETLELLKNGELIAIDQDPACIQGTVAKTMGDVEIWTKDLGYVGSPQKAVAVLNRSDTEQKVTVNWEELGFSGDVTVRDLWQHKYLNVDESYTVTVPAHGTAMWKVSGGEPAAAASLQAEISPKPERVDLTAAGGLDWSFPAEGAAKNAPQLIGAPEIAEGVQTQIYTDAATAYSWSDGAPAASGTEVAKGLRIPGVGSACTLQLPAASTPREVEVYLGGEDARVRIDASIGGRQITRYLSAEEGRAGGLYTLRFQSEDSQPLQITLTAEEAAGEKPALLLEAVVLRSGLEYEIQALTIEDKPKTMDLTALGTGDWLHYGNVDGEKFRRKAGVEAQLSYSGGMADPNNAGDYYTDAFTSYSWTDGAPDVSSSGSTTGMTAGKKMGAFAQIDAPADAGVRTLYVPVTGWNSTVQIDISLDGELIKSQVVPPHYDNNQRVGKLVTVTYSSSRPGALSVRWSIVGQNTPYGNIAVEAAALTAAPGESAVAPMLLGSVSQPGSGGVDLEREGTLDYISFGGRSGDILAQKPDADLLPMYAKKTGAAVSQAPSENIYSWQGGSADKGALQQGLGSVFSLTLPASQTLVQADLYFGLQNADVRVSANLGEESFTEHLYDVKGGTQQMVSLWYQGADPLTVELQITGAFAEDAALRLDAATLKEGGENIVFHPALTQEDNLLTVQNQLLRVSDTGYDHANLVIGLYNQDKALLQTHIEEIDLPQTGETVQRVSQMQLPPDFRLGEVQVYVWSDGQAPLHQPFRASLPLPDREDNGYVGGLTARDKVKNGAILLDVRSEAEYKANALPGAIHIPHTSILTQAAAAIPDKDTEIVVYCSTGKRSSQARRALLYLGYTHVYDMGGYEHWDSVPQPVLPDYHEMILPDAPIALSIAGGENEDVELRYAVGADSAAADARPYTGPITLDKSQTVKAYVFYKGEAVSEARYDYLVFDKKLPDLSGLEVQYCSDMEAKSSQIAYGSLGKDVSTDGHTMTIAGQVFEKGISAHAASQVVYDIPAGARRFVAAAGCDDEVGANSNLISYSVYIDGQQVDQTVTLNIQRYYVFDIPIPRGAKEIRLVADQGNSFLHKNTNMHAEWGIAAFVK